jgi:hypothetical protein
VELAAAGIEVAPVVDCSDVDRAPVEADIYVELQCGETRVTVQWRLARRRRAARPGWTLNARLNRLDKAIAKVCE